MSLPMTLLRTMPSLSRRLLVGSVAVLASTTCLAAKPALAAPHVYSNFIVGIDSLEECLSRTKKAARSSGFTIDVQVVNLKTSNGAEFFADHSSYPMAVNVHCVPSKGTVSIGIAGMNNDRTFSAMREFYESF